MVTPQTEHLAPRRPTIGFLSGWSMYENRLHSYFSGLLQGIRTTVRAHDGNLLIAGGLLQHATPSNRVHAYGGWMIPPDISFLPIGPWNTDGLIVVTPLHSEGRWKYLRGLEEQGFPIVYIGAVDHGDMVCMDNESGVQQAMQHLMAHGHRNIAYIAGEYTPGLTTDSSEHTAAYLDFVRAHDLPQDPRLVSYGFHYEAGGTRAMRQIIESGVEFSAVLASNDESAFGAISALQAAGRRVPDDVAVIGIDDRVDARARKPLLTTLHNPVRQIGAQAIDLLLSRISGERTEHKRVDVPLNLTVRESCGCAIQRVTTQTEPTIAVIDLNKPSQTARQPLIAHIVREVQQNGSYLSPSILEQSSRKLLDGYVLSVQTATAAPLLEVLRSIFDQADQNDEPLQSWQRALTMLQRYIRVPEQREAFAGDLLHTARSEISQHLDWRLTGHFFRRNFQVDLMAGIAERFMSALDAAAIVRIVADELQGLGIQTGAICFVEREGDDPVAWSRLLSADPRASARFQSRRFPPPELCPTAGAFEFVLTPLTLEDEVLGYMAFKAEIIDYCGEITQHVKTALRTARLYREATEGRRLAEEANQIKTRFLSMVSHELRTPLSQIVGLSEMLLHSTSSASDHDPSGRPSNHLSESHRRDIEWIYANAQHLSALISDVLDLANEQIGQFQLKREEIDPASVLHDTLLIGRRLAEEKGLEWHTIISPDLPPVFVDRTRLRQVLLNLLTNAIKFTPTGSITVRIEPNDQEVVFSVTDTGCGVSIADQERIFDEFQQSERTRDRGFGGLGLGLAISKRIVELHGGGIGVHSDGVDTHGATFYFTLPRVERTLTPVPDPVEAQTLSVERSGGARTILIVDDDPRALEMHTRIIETGSDQHIVIAARGGEHALRIIARQHVDLILLDLQMPDLDGFSVLRQIRELDPLHSIPVIVLTAQYLSEQDMTALSHGEIVTVMQKGMFTAQETLAQIEAAFSRSRRLREDTMRIVRSAMAYIHEHYASALTREQIARHVAVSADYLNRCFQQELGVSIMTYFTRYRINRAKSLLATGWNNVGEVASEVGYSNIAYFCRVFRREVGVSPGVYRHQVTT